MKFPESLHDLIVRDVVYQVTHYRGYQGRIICVPEVQLPGVRFDAVAVDVQAKKACAIEVKVRRDDAFTWIRDKRWEAAHAVGAGSTLAFPKSLEDPGEFELPYDVTRMRKLPSGLWDSLAVNWRGPDMSMDLMFAVLSAVRRETFWSHYIDSLGEPIVEALTRLAASEDMKAGAA